MKISARTLAMWIREQMDGNEELLLRSLETEVEENKYSRSPQTFFTLEDQDGDSYAVIVEKLDV